MALVILAALSGWGTWLTAALRMGEVTLSVLLLWRCPGPGCGGVAPSGRGPVGRTRAACGPGRGIPGVKGQWVTGGNGRRRRGGLGAPSYGVVV